METLYIGTNAELGGKGIYAVNLPAGSDPAAHPASPAVSKTPTLAAKAENPSYLALSRNGQTLYAALENAEGSLLSYSVGPGGLTLESRFDTGTGGIVHLTLDRQERFAFAVSYEDACVQAFRLGGPGRGFEKTFEARHSGSGPNRSRQDRAHAHSAWLTPDENELCVCDLGTDQLVVYGIDYVLGKLTRREGRSVGFAPGSGPRHMAFHPNGTAAYVLGELDCRLYGFAWSQERGFAPFQTANLVDSPRSDSTAAAIRITRDGRFVYASVRGEDIIACYAIRGDGTLTDRQVVSTRGAHPRDFILSRAEDRLYCANRDSDSVACFKRDSQTGELTFSETIEGVPSPIALMVRDPCIDSLAGGSGA